MDIFVADAIKVRTCGQRCERKERSRYSDRGRDTERGGWGWVDSITSETERWRKRERGGGQRK